MLNNNLFNIISPKRGLRQGDSISSYFFIIFNEILSYLLSGAEQNGNLNRIKISRSGPSFTYLAFADDLLLCGRATRKEALGFRECLTTYCLQSRQSLNQEKSNIHFSKNFRGSKARELINFFGFRPFNRLDRYLGLPLLFSKSKKSDLQYVVQRVQSRIASWKSHSLSQASRLILAQSVGMAMLAYALMSITIPRSICSKLDATFRDFWWGFHHHKKYVHLKSQNLINSPKHLGGLGFQKMETVNKLFLAKVGWRIFVESSSFWLNLVKAKYLKGHNFMSLSTTRNDSWIWEGILK